MRKLKHLLFLSSILLFLAFNFQGNPPSNWSQQFLPGTGSRQITDMTFTDSLTGYAVATVMSDTSYVLKTTNGGDNWQIIYRSFLAISNIQFLNRDTGYASGGYLYKTTNGGLNWVQLNTPSVSSQAIYVLNQDTIWFVNTNSLVGGVFRTTNGGGSWTQQYSIGSDNPDKIYMFNSRIGFITKNGGLRYISKTTNGGVNWTQIVTNDYFNDIYFADSLTGWKCSVFGMKKTTNGGLNWTTQFLPPTQNTGMTNFSNVNKDTIWGIGGTVLYPGNRLRAILYRTTNGGDNWAYQVPDTSIAIGYIFMNFINKNNGWAYNSTNAGIHTRTGGDTTFLTDIEQISSEVPNDFKLYQNYPNPFNPNTFISYKLRVSGFITIKVYNLQGKEITTLINQKENSGTYTIDFDANKYNLSSGIYFYTLQTDKFKETKKMILFK